MKRIILVCMGIGVTGAALAQVPTIDASRLDKETATAKCMTQARISKDNSLKPVQGAKSSVVAPNAASGTVSAGASVGSGAVMGMNAVSDGVPSIVGGLDLSAVVGLVGGVGKLNAGSAAQTLTALGAVAGAVGNNGSGMSSVGSQVGTLDSSQGAFDQSSVTHVGQAALWNQAVQGAVTTTQQQNSKLVRQSQVTSVQAEVMQFDPNAMVLMGSHK